MPCVWLALFLVCVQGGCQAVFPPGKGALVPAAAPTYLGGLGGVAVGTLFDSKLPVMHV
jgi:hypothetical protein